MNRKLPTVLILCVMALLGVMYWADLTYYTDPASGFVVMGSVWVRYLILLVPLPVALLGLRTVGARAISTLRVKSPVLGSVACLCAVTGALYGGSLLYNAFFGGTDAYNTIEATAAQSKPNVWFIIMGALFVWYGVWMAMCAVQLFTQKYAAPMNSAIFGILAALPFCAQTIYRVFVHPSTIYRMGPFVQNFSALFSMLWFGVLLRGMYIALTRGRVRWMYLLGVYTFLMCTCFEFVLVLHNAVYRGFSASSFLEGLAMGSFGLLAGFVSVSIAGQPEPLAQKEA